MDGVVDDDIIAAAVALARKVAAEKRTCKRLRDVKVDYPNAEGYFQFARNTVSAAAKHFPAPLKCIEATAREAKGELALAAAAYEDAAALDAGDWVAPNNLGQLLFGWGRVQGAEFDLWAAGAVAGRAHSASCGQVHVLVVGT